MLPEKMTGETTCQDLVQCAFNLNQFEISVYRHLLDLGPSRADELAVDMGKDRSTIYRSLQKLMSCGVCHRETRSLEKGGYYHVYIPIGKDKMRERLRQCVEDWYAHMLELLSRFDREL
ncbi:MAG: helix-turn-helix domain-containing protein [Methanomassiliicoccales archaeon]